MQIPDDGRVSVASDALVVLCGPAACGKSSFAVRKFTPTQIVSSDRCRALVGDDEGNQAVSGRAFDLFFRIVEHRLALGRLTVADSTALDSRTRGQLRAAARRYGRPTVLIVFDLGIRRCMRNDSTRSRRVGLNVIRDHRQRLLRLLPQFQAEGYDRIIRITARNMNALVVRVQQEGKTNT